MRVPTIGSVIPARDDRDWVTAHELVNEAGITYRQADYWFRTDLLHAIDDPTPGSGVVRRVDADQVTRACAIKTLLEGGVSLQTIRQVIDEFVATGTATSGQLTFTINKSGDTAA